MSDKYKAPKYKSGNSRPTNNANAQCISTYTAQQVKASKNPSELFGPGTPANVQFPNYVIPPPRVSRFNPGSDMGYSSN